MSKEKGQGLVEYALILILLAIILIGFNVVVVDPISRSYQFDRAIEAGTIIIDSNAIPVNTDIISHPASVPGLEEIPVVDLSQPYNIPRGWTLSGCIEINLPSEATILHAATTAPPEVAELINIQMPIPGAQSVNICGPEGITTQLYLWVD